MPSKETDKKQAEQIANQIQSLDTFHSGFVLGYLVHLETEKATKEHSIEKELPKNKNPAWGENSSLWSGDILWGEYVNGEFYHYIFGSERTFIKGEEIFEVAYVDGVKTATKIEYPPFLY